MSRPPRPHHRHTTTGSPPPGRPVLDYLPLGHAELLALERALAAGELGLVSTGEEGDFARALMDLSALAAHVLSFYQNRYAGEVFLGTAQSARSLVQHGRRLSYEPDPGLAATGYAVFTVREGLSGGIAKGLALASTPLGEATAQHYETLAQLPVRAEHNRIEVHGAVTPVTVAPGDDRVRIAGTGHGLASGEWVVLEGPAHFQACRLTAVSELAGGSTEVQLDPAYAGPAAAAADLRLRARPAERLRLFGWKASPLEVPDAALKLGQYPDTHGADPAQYGYLADPYSGDHVYLVGHGGEPLDGTVVVRLEGTTGTALRVTEEQSLTVAFQKTVEVEVTKVTWPENATSPTVTTETEDVHTAFSEAVTAVVAEDAGETVAPRAAQDVRDAVWLAGWELELELVAGDPSQVPAASPLELAGEVPGLEPGQRLVRSTLAGSRSQVLEITAVDLVGGRTAIAYEAVPTGDPAVDAAAWLLGDLVLAGNVARISHGKTTEEVLGGSDGTSAFQTFELGEVPLTHLPGAQGGEPALELRVGGVLWERVEDFEESGPEDLHYRVLRDEDNVTRIQCGDGLHGAVPPSGKKHVVATYRVGLGLAGNVGPGRVSRIKKSHPLLEEVTNPLPVGGGTEPASAEDVRHQATRYLKSFDRAVSVQDHADLCLLFPGVARASATWTELGTAGPSGAKGPVGVRVIAATSEGEAPEALAELRAFLQARRDGSVPLQVVGPSPLDLLLTLYVEVDPAYLEQDVEEGVRAALHGPDPADPGSFTFAARELGQPAFLSEVYARVAAVPGVAFAEVRRFTLAGVSPAVAHVLKPAPEEWLRLLPEALSFATPSEVQG